MTNLLVDMDDTLTDTNAVMLAWINERLDEPVRFTDLTRAHREEATGRYFELVQEFLSLPEEHRFEPFADALDGIRRLHRAGHRIHIASSRKEGLHRTTIDWLAKHGFADYVTEIHPRSSEVKGTEFKRTVASRIKPAAAFDDTHNVVTTLAAVCPAVYLIDQPWNTGEIPPNVRRVRSFGEAATRFLSG